ncbi:MAG: hypothetical protein ACLRVB_04195, partial [Blautia sp.]
FKVQIKINRNDQAFDTLIAIGKFSKLPYNTKTLREDRTAAEMGVYRLCDPPQAENPVAQDSLFC